MFKPPESVFNLACADVRVEKMNGSLAAESSVRSAQPGRRVVFGPENIERVRGYASHTVQAIRFVRIEPATLLPASERPCRHVEDARRLRYRQPQTLAERFQRAVRQSILDPLAHVSDSRNAFALEDA